ncbi:MAG: hypothetical protein IJ736_04940, partial [Firmicutes bacterium]|nr:hypothetical protein [Bacillota bacterium]
MKYLKQYLNRYRAAKNRKDNLTHRLEEIRAEFGSPIKGIGFEQSAVSKTHKVGDGAAALTFRLAEIEDRIETERVIMQQRLAETMDIIELLPKDSIERDIVELKYIDGI